MTNHKMTRSGQKASIKIRMKDMTVITYEDNNM